MTLYNIERTQVIKKDHRERWKKIYSKFMIVWAIVSHIWLVIQAVEIYKNKSSKGLSLPAFLILLTSGVFWFIYGFFVLPGKNNIIVISATVSSLLVLLVVIGIFIYS